MGIYLNSEKDVDASKKSILENIPSLKELSRNEVIKTLPKQGETYLCLVSNGLFKALGVLFDKREVEAFTDPDDYRQKYFYSAKIDDIKPFIGKEPIERIMLGQGETK